MNKKVIIGLVCGLVFLSCVLMCGFDFIRSSSIIPAHEDIDVYENTMTMQESLNKMVLQERTLYSYMKGFHFAKNKEKVFLQFVENLEYYSKVFSSDNENKFNYTGENSNPVYISASNRSLKQGKSYCIGDMEIMPIFKGDSPPNAPTFPNLRINKPKAPFLKLVYNPWFCAQKNDLGGGAYAAICNGPNFFVAEPDYKYLKETYSKYLNKVWAEYFDAKIKQQTDLRNCGFTNGNGGSAPIYIGEKEIKEWTDLFIKIITKYPNFIMKENIKYEIENINYPNFKTLMERLDKNSEIYDYIKSAEESLESEYE